MAHRPFGGPSLSQFWVFTQTASLWWLLQSRTCRERGDGRCGPNTLPPPSTGLDSEATHAQSPQWPWNFLGVDPTGPGNRRALPTEGKALANIPSSSTVLRGQEGHGRHGKRSSS